jgi:hypothetical protein
MLRLGFQTKAREEQGKLPQLLQEESFTCATLANAVNHYIELGEKRTVEEFRSLDEIGSRGRGFWMNERIGWLCRITFQSRARIFQPRARKFLRRPYFGGLVEFPLGMPGMENDWVRWPLFPVASSGLTYFVLREGYTIGGFPEPLPEYVAYCQKNGVFRKKPVDIPTRELAIKDATNLRQSPEWKGLKWEHQWKQYKYRYNEEWIWRFIIRQAESIPDGVDKQ